ncbi:TPA: hypothetical protein ACE8BZ_001899, partial [Neisseria gonorrhoeae]
PNAAETVEAVFNVAAAAKVAKLAKAAKPGKVKVSGDFSAASYSKHISEETSALSRIASNQKNTINLDNKVSNSIVKKQSDKRVNSILRDAEKGRKTKGGTKQYEKSGDFDKAVSDFNALRAKNIQNRGDKKLIGELADGRKVNVRMDSTDGRPTLEIQQGNKKTKIRYGKR